MFRRHILALSLAPSLAPILAGAGIAPALAQDVTIAPHRAIYNISLDSARELPLTGADGQMLFSWDRNCEGWTTEQIYNAVLSNDEGGQIPIRSDYSTFESLDGTFMTFVSRDYDDGEVDEVVRGEANLAAGGGVAVYDEPAGLTIDLPAGTLFPTEHTIDLIRAAINGTRFFPAVMFDGTDDDGLTEVTAVVGQEFQGEHEVDIAAVRGWRINLAFFGADGDPSGTPDVETSIGLLENGVVTDLLIDYGDFSLRADLTEIEPYDAPAC